MRKQLTQGPLVPFPIDRVESQDKSDEGAEKGNKLDQRKQGSPCRKEHEKHKLGFGNACQILSDIQSCHVSRYKTHHGDQRKEDYKPVTAKMVRQFLFEDCFNAMHGYVSRKYFI